MQFLKVTYTVNIQTFSKKKIDPWHSYTLAFIYVSNYYKHTLFLRRLFNSKKKIIKEIVTGTFTHNFFAQEVIKHACFFAGDLPRAQPPRLPVLACGQPVAELCCHLRRFLGAHTRRHEQAGRNRRHHHTGARERLEYLVD